MIQTEYSSLTNLNIPTFSTNHDEMNGLEYEQHIILKVKKLRNKQYISPMHEIAN